MKTLAEIRAGWWWKRMDEAFKPQNDIQPPYWIAYWSHGQDWAAFAYEMARRSSKRAMLPYPELTWFQCAFLLKTFSEGKARSEWAYTYFPTDKGIHHKPGYSCLSMWKLELPDNFLLTAFMHFIEEQREIHQITPKKRAGQTSKGPPWLWCELLDVTSNGIDHPERIGDTGRTLRKAKNKSAECYHRFVAAFRTIPKPTREAISFLR